MFDNLISTLSFLIDFVTNTQIIQFYSNTEDELLTNCYYQVDVLTIASERVVNRLDTLPMGRKKFWEQYISSLEKELEIFTKALDNFLRLYSEADKLIINQSGSNEFKERIIVTKFLTQLKKRIVINEQKLLIIISSHNEKLPTKESIQSNDSTVYIDWQMDISSISGKLEGVKQIKEGLAKFVQLKDKFQKTISSNLKHIDNGSTKHLDTIKQELGIFQSNFHEKIEIPKLSKQQRILMEQEQQKREKEYLIKRKVEEGLSSTTKEIDLLLLEIEALQKESKEVSTSQEQKKYTHDEINTKIYYFKKLIEKRSNLLSKVPVRERDYYFVNHQNKLNLLLNKVKLETGDALCNVNVLIEGSTIYDGSNTEKYFASLLQLLETCVLHERVWIAGSPLNESLKVDNFPYGYFAHTLQSEDILQAYSGIVSLTNAETVKKRVNLYSSFFNGEEKHGRLLQDIAFSETARLKYIPHRDDAHKVQEFAKDIEDKIYSPLFDSVYEQLEKGLLSQFNEIKSFAKTDEIFIPPISTIILSRASKFEDIPEVTMEVRRKFSKIRISLMEYENTLRDISVSLEKRLKILSNINLMNQELAKPYDYLDSLFITEWSDAWEFANELLDGELSINKLAGKILGKPIAKAIKNVRLRNIAYLFNLRRKIYATPSHNNLVKKFFPKINIEELNNYMNLYSKPKAG